MIQDIIETKYKYMSIILLFLRPTISKSSTRFPLTSSEGIFGISWSEFWQRQIFPPLRLPIHSLINVPYFPNSSKKLLVPGHQRHLVDSNPLQLLVFHFQSVIRLHRIEPPLIWVVMDERCIFPLSSNRVQLPPPRCKIWSLYHYPKSGHQLYCLAPNLPISFSGLPTKRCSLNHDLVAVHQPQISQRHRTSCLIFKAIPFLAMKVSMTLPYSSKIPSSYCQGRLRLRLSTKTVNSCSLQS
ncbi:hypothetical protein QQP08_015655 [Theobroma cacao]|nr:hypothetical protein QQP08_015655 [Theobroma cacao]